MKKVLLIARAKDAESLAKASSFADGIQKLLAEEVSIENCEISELFFEIGKQNFAVYHPKKGFDLRDFDLVIIRHIGKFWNEAHAITSYCEKLDIPYTDTYLNRPLLDNKISTEYLLWAADLKEWPKSFYGPTDELVKRFGELGDKAVLKDNEGSKGRLNYIVSSAAEIVSYTSENPEKRFILQEFIPNEGDLRVVVMNGEVPMVIGRTGDGSSHLNNTSQGGDAIILDLAKVDPRIIDMSIKAAKVTGLQVAGVDIMVDTRTGEYYFLEINNAPQISSGSFTEEKSAAYADMIRSLLKDGVK